MSLITTLPEITALYPDQRWSEREYPQLLAYLEEETESTLIPILGDTLYAQIEQDYTSLSDIIIPQTYDTTPDADTLTRLRIIRACQRIIFFRMLANNSGIFAISFNRGGLNRLSADNFEPADEKSRKDFERDVWKKSKRNIETLLLNLERDSREARIYTTAWQKSPYYYYHSDLLFTTAEEMKEFYTGITDREQYINLIPQIRLAQNTYIIPRLGDKALRLLLTQKYGHVPDGSSVGLSSVPDSSVGPSGLAPVPSASPEVPSVPDGSSVGLSSEVSTTVPEASASVVLRDLRTYTLTALSLYIQARITNNQHLYSDADISLSQASKLLKDNRTLLFPETPSTPPCHCKRPPIGSLPTDALLDIGSIHY